jgi:hypothetical protein
MMRSITILMLLVIILSMSEGVPRGNNERCAKELSYELCEDEIDCNRGCIERAIIEDCETIDENNCEKYVEECDKLEDTTQDCYKK